MKPLALGLLRVVVVLAVLARPAAARPNVVVVMTLAILSSRLAKLNTCQGTSCHVSAGRLPEPG